MGYKIEKLQIDPNDPFKYDLLNLKPHAESIKGLLETIDEPFVIGLNGVWGSGKTTYLEMLQPYLELEKFKVVYFSAWENDWAEDPLIAVFSEYTSFLDSVQTPGEVLSTKMTRFKESAKSALPGLVKGGVNAAIKVATGGGLDVSALMNDFVDKSISGYQDGKNSLHQMQHALKQIQDVLKSNLKIQKPLIFIIDELDRCNPKYAVNLLERVKHIFNIEGIIFLLAYDKKQLSTSIKHFYGPETDTDNYLRRMIDLEILLPQQNSSLYFTNLFVKNDFHNTIYHEIKSDIGNLDYAVNHYCSILNDYFQPTLRTQNLSLLIFRMMIRIIPTIGDHFIITYFLIMLYLKDEHLYRKFTQVHISIFEYPQFFSELFQNKIFDLNRGEEITQIQTVIAAYMMHHFKLYAEYYINQFKNDPNELTQKGPVLNQINTVYSSLNNVLVINNNTVSKIIKILENLSIQK